MEMRPSALSRRGLGDVRERDLENGGIIPRHFLAELEFEGTLDAIDWIRFEPDSYIAPILERSVTEALQSFTGE